MYLSLRSIPPPDHDLQAAKDGGLHAEQVGAQEPRVPEEADGMVERGWCLKTSYDIRSNSELFTCVFRVYPVYLLQCHFSNQCIYSPSAGQTAVSGAHHKGL